MSFNYLGQERAAAPEGEALFAAAAGPVGPVRGLDQPRAHRLVVEGAVHGGVLRMGFYYGGRAWRSGTMERLAAAYADALRALVQAARSRPAAAPTAADFPAAGVDQDELDAIFAQLAGMPD